MMRSANARQQGAARRSAPRPSHGIGYEEAGLEPPESNPINRASLHSPVTAYAGMGHPGSEIADDACPVGCIFAWTLCCASRSGPLNPAC